MRHARLPQPTYKRHGLRRDSRTFDTVDSTPILTPEVDDADEDEGIRGNIAYTKGQAEIPLESRIERLFYINLYGQEIFPEPSSAFYDAIDKRDVLVYSCGSLWTSIVPCLALRGVASSIAQSKTLKAKVLLCTNGTSPLTAVNATNDRETPNYTAMDYIDTIATMLRHYNVPALQDPVPWETSSFITHLAYLEGGGVEVDCAAIEARGITPVCIPNAIHQTMFTTASVEWAMERVAASLSK